MAKAHRKATAKLEARREAYNNTVRRCTAGGERKYKRPGSMNLHKGGGTRA